MAEKNAADWRRRLRIVRVAETPPPPRPDRRRRPPIWSVASIAAIAIAFTILISYYVYAHRRIDYFVSRDLRLLASLSDDLDATLAAYRGFIRDLARSGGDTKLDFKRADYTPETLAKIDHQFPAFDRVQRELLPPPAPPALGTQPQPAGESLVEQLDDVDGREQFTIRYSGPTSDGNNRATSVGEVPLAKLLEHVFQERLDVFDVVLVTDESGRTIYHAHPFEASQQRGPGYSINAFEFASRNDVVRARASDVVITNVSQLRERKGVFDSVPVDARLLRASTHNGEVEIGGVSYYFFSQPCRFSSPVDTERRQGATGATAPPERAWIVCGLVPKTRFIYESISISSTLVLLGVAALMLLIGSWPFVRISLMGELEPMTITHVIFAGVGALALSSVAVLVICDTVAYRRLSSLLDLHLRLAAGSIDSSLQRDIDGAFSVLQRLERSAKQAKDGASGGLETDAAMIPQDVLLNVAGLPFPSFSQYTCIDARGNEIVKRSVGVVPLPTVAVTDPYFSDVKLGRTIVSDAGNTLAIESIRSSMSAAPQTVIAKASDDPRCSVAALTTSSTAFINPILPPSTGFVIINPAGAVLYHADPQRNARENFFSETDHDRQLRSHVLARREGFVDLRYWGTDLRAYVRPMRNVPWTLIVYRDRRLARTANIEMIVLTLLCLGVCGALLVLAILVVALAVPTYRAGFIWPLRRKAKRYGRLRAFYLLLGASYVLAGFAFDNRSFVVLTLLLPLQALSATYLILSDYRVWKTTRMAIVGALIGLIALYVTWRAPISPTLANSAIRDWVRAIMLVLYALRVLIVTSSQHPFRWIASLWGGRYSRSRPSGPYQSRYVSCATWLSILVAVLPTIGFFTVAAGYETEALVKYGQLSIAEQVEKRLTAGARTAIGPSTLPSWEVIAGFFGTRYYLNPPRLKEQPVCLSCSSQLPGNDQDIPHLLQSSLPQYSEHSVAMRELHHDLMNDGSAFWSGRPVLSIHKELNLDQQTLAKTYPRGVPPDRRRAEQRTTRLPSLVVESLLPRILPWSRAGADRRFREPSLPYMNAANRFPTLRTTALRQAVSQMAASRRDSKLQKVSRLGLYLLLVYFTFRVIIRRSARFIAQKVFLLDVEDSIWLETGQKLRPILGDNILLTHWPATKVDTLVAVENFKYVDMRKVDATSSASLLREIDSDRTFHHLLLTHFAESVIDPKLAAERLKFVEHLLILPERTIVIATEVTSSIIAMSLGEIPDTGKTLRERFEKLLDRFFSIDEEEILGTDIAHYGRPVVPSVLTRMKIAFAKKILNWPRFWQKVAPSLLEWAKEQEPEKGPEETEKLPPPQYVLSSFVRRLARGMLPLLAGTGHLLRWLSKRRYSSRLSYLFWTMSWSLRRFMHALAMRIGDQRAQGKIEVENWLRKEARDHRFLNEIREQLLKRHPNLDLTMAIDEMAERAQGYYESIWASCSAREKLVLMQIGRERLLNCHSALHRRMLRRLMARRLVSRENALKLFNHTFRVFVREASLRDRITETEAGRPRSAWERIQTPVVMLVIVVAAMFFATQRDLFNATTAVLTALAAGIPALVNIVGVVTERRLEATPKL